MTVRLALAALTLSLGLAGPANAQPRPLFQDQAPSAPQPPGSAIPEPTPEIIIRELDAPSADAAGRGSATELAGGWGDTLATTILAALEALPPQPMDPAARRLQVDLLQRPTPESQPPGALLAVRLRRLIDLGETDAAGLLAAEAGFAALRTPVLAPVAARLELAAGRDAQACTLLQGVDEFAAGLGETNLFCTILGGDLDTALVLFSALNETDSLREQPFAALAALALGLGSANAIDWSARAEPVDLALADHLRVQVPEEAVGAMDLAAARRLTHAPDSRLRAAARARLDEADGSFTTTGAEATRLRAIADPVTRAKAIVALWQATADPAARLAYLAQLAPLAATIAPRAELAAEASTLAAILIAAAQEGSALAWFDMLETQRQGDREAADRTAVLMILAGMIDPSRMPPRPAGLFTPADASWLAAGLAGQAIPLASPWRDSLRSLPPLPPEAPALAMARALADLASEDPSIFARGLRALVAADHRLDARAIACRSVIVRLNA